jgi:hypothetical protein
MLPAIVKWTPDTVWMPAEFVAFDSSRSGSEYEFQWIPGIIWPDGIAPDPLSFYRSAADWDMIEEAPRLRSDQVTTHRFLSLAYDLMNFFTDLFCLSSY